MATIKEIAALAGVSRGTVDRVLNHRGRVNPQTARKVLQIAHSLNYKPNRAGLALAAQKKKLKLGVLCFTQNNPFFTDVLEGVQTKAKELEQFGCTVIVRRTTGEESAQLEALDELASQGISGLALAPFNDSQIRERIQNLWDQGIPTVTFNTDIEHSPRIAYVGSNYTRSGETAAGLMAMIAPGPLKVGIVTGSYHILCHTQRILGFSQALKIRCPQGEIIETVAGLDDDEKSRQQTLDLLTRHPEINALFFAAAGVQGGCQAVQELDLAGKIPIITFDLVPATRKLIQEGVICASICQQPRLQGSLPLEILFNYLTAGEMPQKELYYLSSDIRIRENLDDPEFFCL